MKLPRLYVCFAMHAVQGISSTLFHNFFARVWIKSSSSNLFFDDCKWVLMNCHGNNKIWSHDPCVNMPMSQMSICLSCRWSNDPCINPVDCANGPKAHGWRLLICQLCRPAQVGRSADWPQSFHVTCLIMILQFLVSIFRFASYFSEMEFQLVF